MAWIISNALMKDYENSHSSPEPVAESLAESCSDGELSAPSKSSHTPLAYLPPDKMTAFSRRSLSGMTFALLTADRGEDVLTWFLAGSPVRTSVRQGKKQVLKELNPGYGKRWRESLVKYDLKTSSWKTHRCLLEMDLAPSLVTLPRWGMTQDGVCLEPDILGEYIKEIDCGSWRPIFKMPTPCAGTDKWGGTFQETGGSQQPLRRTWLGAQTVNPGFWEDIMGWPVSWTDLKPLATDKFQQWLHSHGKYSAAKQEDTMNCQNCQHTECSTNDDPCNECVERDEHGEAVVVDGKVVLKNYEPTHA